MSKKSIKPPTLLKSQFNDDQMDKKLDLLKKAVEKQSKELQTSGQRWKDNSFSSNNNQNNINNLSQKDSQSSFRNKESLQKDNEISNQQNSQDSFRKKELSYQEKKRLLDQKFKQVTKQTKKQVPINQQKNNEIKQKNPYSLGSLFEGNFKNQNTIEKNINFQIMKQKDQKNQQEIYEFLNQIQLEKYYDIFIQFGFDEMEVINELNISVLKQMGISQQDQNLIMLKVYQMNQKNHETKDEQINIIDEKQNNEKQNNEKQNNENQEDRLGDGSFDEEEQRKQFQQALNAYRGQEKQQNLDCQINDQKSEQSEYSQQSQQSEQSEQKIKQKKKVTFSEGAQFDVQDTLKESKQKMLQKFKKTQKQETEQKFSFFQLGNWTNNFDQFNTQEKNVQKTAQKIQKQICFQCLQQFNKSAIENEGYIFCSDSCHEIFLNLNQQNCTLCSRYFLKQNGKMFENQWYCCQRCAQSLFYVIKVKIKKKNEQKIIPKEQIEDTDDEPIDLIIETPLQKLLQKYKQEI